MPRTFNSTPTLKARPRQPAATGQWAVNPSVSSQATMSAPKSTATAFEHSSRKCTTGSTCPFFLPSFNHYLARPPSPPGLLLLLLLLLLPKSHASPAEPLLPLWSAPVADGGNLAGMLHAHDRELLAIVPAACPVGVCHDDAALHVPVHSHGSKALRGEGGGGTREGEGREGKGREEGKRREGGECVSKCVNWHECLKNKPTPYTRSNLLSPTTAWSAQPRWRGART